MAIEKGYLTKLTDAIVIEDVGERGIVESIAGGKPKPVAYIGFAASARLAEVRNTSERYGVC